MYSALPIKLDSVKPFQFPSGVGRPMYLSVYAESGGNSEEGLALFVLVVMDTLKKKSPEFVFIRIKFGHICV